MLIGKTLSEGFVAQFAGLFFALYFTCYSIKSTIICFPFGSTDWCFTHLVPIMPK